MPNVTGSPELVKALIGEGLVPRECHDITILIAVDGAVTLKYDVYVTNVDLKALSRAFAQASEPDQFTRQLRDRIDQEKNEP